MGRGEPGIGPGLTTQRSYFRQESFLRQPGDSSPLMMGMRVLLLR